MSAKRLTYIGSVATIAFFSVLSIDYAHHQPAFSAALAGNGNGHSGGNGGGNGNGGGGGNGKGNANGGGAGGQSAILQPGAIASALGRLNASHASATALANAAPNSAVGKIAAYEKALTSYQSNSTDQSDLTALKLLLAPDGTCPAGPCQTALATVKLDLASVEAALAAAANKPITAVVVTAVDTNLGLTVDPAVEAAIAADAGP